MTDADRSRGKLARAVLVLDEFRRTEAEFIRTRATDAKHDQVGGLLIEMKPIPESLSAIAGDVLQDLRSALDHEVHRMAAAAEGQDWPGLSKSAFPLHRDDEDAYALAREALIGALPDAVKEVIDGLQLFRVPRDPDADALELLNELARLDRHRLLHLTAMQVTQLDADMVPPAQLTGKLIGEITPATPFGVRVRMKMRLAFQDAPAHSAPVGETLVNLAKTVRRVIRRMREAEVSGKSVRLRCP